MECYLARNKKLSKNSNKLSFLDDELKSSSDGVATFRYERTDFITVFKGKDYL
jgi:hypothetical protein